MPDGREMLIRPVPHKDHGTRQATVTAAAATRPSAEERTQDQLLDLIVYKDDVSWRSIIFGLIDSEQMDPWDIDLSRLSAKFLEQLKKLKEMDFRISGKVVLASAILLKMKAERLYDEELGALDHLIQSVESNDELLLDSLDPFGEPLEREALPSLIPRTPQPRKRRVSVYDLVEALGEALDVEARRPERIIPRVLDTIDPPEHHVDISVVIKQVYDKVNAHYAKTQEILDFSKLAPSQDARDRVLTFIPLLHLENARRVEMQQTEHFGPITVHLLEAAPQAPEAPVAAAAASTQAPVAAKRSKKTKS